MNTGTVPYSEVMKSFKRTRIGETTFCFMSISMVTMGPASGRAIRPAGLG